MTENFPHGHFGTLHGDCDKLLPSLIEQGARYDLVLTDPPYNVGKDFGNDSDKLPLGVFLEQMYRRIDMLSRLLAPTGSLIWFGIHDYICYFQVYMNRIGLNYRRLNIWHYRNGFSRSSRSPATHYEPFLWFSKDASTWTYNTDEVRVPYKSAERLRSDVKYKDARGNEKVWRPHPKGANRSDVWDFPTLSGKAFSSERTAHPSQKPEALITEIIKAFCPIENGIFHGSILDPFHGSGTLGVCCERLNRLGHRIKWTGIEVEDRWCKVASNRLANL